MRATTAMDCRHCLFYLPILLPTMHCTPSLRFAAAFYLHLQSLYSSACTLSIPTTARSHTTRLVSPVPHTRLHLHHHAFSTCSFLRYISFGDLSLFVLFCIPLHALRVLLLFLTTHLLLLFIQFPYYSSVLGLAGLHTVHHPTGANITPPHPFPTFITILDFYCEFHHTYLFTYHHHVSPTTCPHLVPSYIKPTYCGLHFSHCFSPGGLGTPTYHYLPLPPYPTFYTWVSDCSSALPQQIPPLHTHCLHVCDAFHFTYTYTPVLFLYYHSTTFFTVLFYTCPSTLVSPFLSLHFTGRFTTHTRVLPRYYYRLHYTYHTPLPTYYPSYYRS